jgi:hypothetical protein
VQWAVHDSEYVWFELEQEGEERNIEVLYKSKFATLIVSYLEELMHGIKSSVLSEGSELFSDSSSS